QSDINYFIWILIYLMNTTGKYWNRSNVMKVPKVSMRAKRMYRLFKRSWILKKDSGSLNRPSTEKENSLNTVEINRPTAWAPVNCYCSSVGNCCSLTCL